MIIVLVEAFRVLFGNEGSEVSVLLRLEKHHGSDHKGNSRSSRLQALRMRSPFIEIFLHTCSPDPPSFFEMNSLIFDSKIFESQPLKFWILCPFLKKMKVGTAVTLKACATSRASSISTCVLRSMSVNERHGFQPI